MTASDQARVGDSNVLKCSDRVGHPSARTGPRLALGSVPPMRSAMRWIPVACALCSLAAYVIVLSPPAHAAGASTSTSLLSWYQESGHRVLGNLEADANRFARISSSTSSSVEYQDCKDFRSDALSASNGKSPPQATLARDYRYFLLAAAKSFKNCMAGIKSDNGIQVFAGTQVGARAVSAVAKIILGAKAGQVVPVPPSTVSLTPSIPASAYVPECESDFKVLEIAIDAYDAQRHADPTPPKPWAASTYADNFRPLQESKNGGPFLSQSFDTTHFVVEYDSSGNVWVEPPGQYDTSYNPAHGSTAACAAVVR